MNPIRRVLIAIDNEAIANKVVAHALQIIDVLHATVALVSIVDRPIIMTESGLGMSDIGLAQGSTTELDVEEVLLKGFKHLHAQLLGNLLKDYNVETFIELGDPQEGIINIATQWQADLIVLGTHGRTGLAHFFMGSVAEKVMQHTLVPLLIVPTKA